MLNVQDLHKHYGGSHILRGLSFDLKPGEITVVLGRNGVGKTTLLKSLIGVVPITSGGITLSGEPINKLKTYQRVARGPGLCAAGPRDLRAAFGH